ncbi:Smr/MutS family protein [Thioalkalivibrio sulfidiphilus]|uniref:Smr/MutS family protein n=1 Tax=Thioalkalivibrio sulfidiphilus TaxID=1033854 RepID=UPI003BAE3F84
MDHDSPPDDDAALFRAAVGEVRPVRQDRHAGRGKPPRPHPQHSEATDREVVRDLMSDPFGGTEVQPGDELQFARTGLQRNTYRKLRRGQYRLDGELDLHGMTTAEARQALALFLLEARDLSWRCVRVIHGKGLRSSNRGPVLKGHVAHWLTQRDEVLAFCSARPADGGTGAVYVLLKR